MPHSVDNLQLTDRVCVSPRRPPPPRGVDLSQPRSAAAAELLKKLPLAVAIFVRVTRRPARFWSGSYPVKGSSYCCFSSGYPRSRCPKTSGESPKKAKTRKPGPGCKTLCISPDPPNNTHPLTHTSFLLLPLRKDSRGAPCRRPVRDTLREGEILLATCCNSLVDTHPGGAW